MSADETIRVLCVDDEELVLKALARTLHVRSRISVDTATSPAVGLEKIAQANTYAVVISDLRMPEMDGIQFLGKVREVAPDTVRVLLTGEQDFTSAVEAVNSGSIFRFLTKPCPAPVLLDTIDAAVEQHRLVTAERVLLEQTLFGCVKTLTDLLALVNPEAFARANRVKSLTHRLAERMGEGLEWQVELAAMLSQIGCVTLPPETAQRLYHGRDLDASEAVMVEQLPQRAAELLGSIPRLERVRQILARQNAGFSERSGAERVPLGSRLIKAAADFDLLQSSGQSDQVALASMRSRALTYDPKVLDALAEILGEADEDRIEQMRVPDLYPGLVLVEDVMTLTGLLVIGRGQELTLAILERLRNFSMRRMNVVEPIAVRVTGTAVPPAGAAVAAGE